VIVSLVRSERARSSLVATDSLQPPACAAAFGSSERPGVRHSKSFQLLLLRSTSQGITVNLKAVSFRSQLKGTLSDFLTKEEMQCPQTEEGLLELVVALSHYTEEGYALFPQVILCDDLSATLRLLQCSDPLHIDTGPREPQTMTQALKRCAPLARGGWVVYMQRFEDHIEYGVFHAPSSPTALDIRDTVQALTEEAANLHIILASQLTDKAVELVGARSGVLHLYLSATPDNAPSPRDALDHLITACCDDVAIDAREQVQSFLRTTLSDAFRHCHGTLVGVLTVGQNPAEVSSDGVILREPISFTTLVKQHEIQRSDQSLAALTAYGHLLAGMLSSDGIVLLDSECKLLGYNLFVRDDEQNTSPPSHVVGGARRRAYMKLRQLIDRGTLQACFICSSDGGTEFYKRDTP
jgi:hypothetical protein